MAASTRAAPKTWCSSRRDKSWTRCCAGRGTATAASRPRRPRRRRTVPPAPGATRSRSSRPRRRERDDRQAEPQRRGIFRPARRRAVAPAARQRATGGGTGRAPLSSHEVPQVRLRPDHRRMARDSDRPVHALPRVVVRRGRGREPDRPPPTQRDRPRVPGRAPGRVRGQGLGRVKPSPFPGDPPITPQLVREHHLTDAEYGRITALLGRTPTFAELGVFSALWSEHCSYKHSRPILKTFPTTGPQVVQGPGENAGVLRLPDGWAVAFKIESHNHPSAVEPHQGAATGVGGILRDVFTMGARPIATLDPLRFGPLTTGRARWLFEGVVNGISSYGNSVGVPTVGGEVTFDECYAENPLVNVMCVGVMPREHLVLGQASGDGNLAVLLGATTGRDGIRGVSGLASAGFGDDDQAKRPSVEVGDPFEEKRLIEACLALYDAGLVVGIPDLGGAGLPCATSETAARGGLGMGGGV